MGNEKSGWMGSQREGCHTKDVMGVSLEEVDMDTPLVLSVGTITNKRDICLACWQTAYMIKLGWLTLSSFSHR